MGDSDAVLSNSEMLSGGRESATDARTKSLTVRPASSIRMTDCGIVSPTTWHLKV